MNSSTIDDTALLSIPASKTSADRAISDATISDATISDETISKIISEKINETTSEKIIAEPSSMLNDSIPGQPRRRQSGFDRPAHRQLGTQQRPIALYKMDGERYYIVEPRGEVKANIILVHGLTEHAGRHFQTARWLAELGYRSFLLDLVGHGGHGRPLADSLWVYEALATASNSTDAEARLKEHHKEKNKTEQNKKGKKATAFTPYQFETLSRTAFETHFRQLDRLLAALQASRLDAGLPLFLLGHSMGGLLCSELAWRWHRRGVENLAGVILSSPAYRPQGRPDQWLENLLIGRVWEERQKHFAPLRTLVKGALSFNIPYDTTWSAPWISDLEVERELYRNDPLVPHQGPSSYASSIEDQMVRTVGRTEPFPVDGLLLLPGEDGVTSVQGGLDFAAKMQAGVGTDRFALQHYSQVCAHDLLRSSVSVQVRATIAGWLAARLP
jgi:alpha-beta hydrolase superfamily lysophospholipase